MAGRNKLTAEQIAEREAEKNALNADKRQYNKKKPNQAPPIMEQNNMEQPNPEQKEPEIKQGFAESKSAFAPAAPEPGTSDQPPAYNTFSAPTIGRTYSTPIINPELMDREIPEAPMGGMGATNAQDAVKLLDEKPKTAGAAENAASHIADQTGVNQLPAKEQAHANALSADLVIEGYALLNTGVGQWLKVSPDSLREKHIAGKLDINRIIIPADHATQQDEVTTAGFFEDINRQIKEEFVVKDDFKDRVRPPLERLLAKMGLGISDGMYVAGLFIADAAPKIQSAISIKQTINKAMSRLESDHAGMMREVANRVAAELQREADIRHAADELLKGKQTPEPQEKPKEPEEQRAAA